MAEEDSVDAITMHGLFIGLYSLWLLLDVTSQNTSPRVAVACYLCAYEVAEVLAINVYRKRTCAC